MMKTVSGQLPIYGDFRDACRREVHVLERLTHNSSSEPVARPVAVWLCVWVLVHPTQVGWWLKIGHMTTSQPVDITTALYHLSVPVINFTKFMSIFKNNDNKKLQQTAKNTFGPRTHKFLSWLFSSEFKLVKPFVFLSFIFEPTDRYKVFHVTHSWQLCCCSMRQICCDLMIRN